MKRKQAFVHASGKTISEIIDDYIRDPVHREMVRDWLVNNMDFSALESKYGYSLRHTKRIIYRASDIVLKIYLDKTNQM